MYSMEAPVSECLHFPKSDSLWPNSAPFKSPDLIELNSDTERNPRKVEREPLNYSSSQDEVETEDDGNDGTDTLTLGKEVIPGVYDSATNDEESCHLLQTEEDSENSDSEQPKEIDPGSESSLSDYEYGPDGEPIPYPDHLFDSYPCARIWSVDAEQRAYYTKYFLQLQPDPKGLVSGDVAKQFFERSKLSHEDLRIIWDYADYTRDGCLDLNEFILAMHLVVVRRHGLPIPPDYLPEAVEARRKELKEYMKREYQTRLEQKTSGFSDARNLVERESIERERKLRAVEKSKKSMTNQTSGELKDLSHQSFRMLSKAKTEEWTTFDNEPVNFSSTCDTSGLVAPVPIRLSTPEESLLSSATNHYQSNTCASASKVQQLQLKSIQRPKYSGQHPKPSKAGTIAPPPPPRRKTHIRSSSLDLNRLTTSSDLQSNGPEPSAQNFLSPTHQGGAFSIYRKPQAPKSESIPEPVSVLNDTHQGQTSTESSQVRQEVTELRNDNEILTNITSQLMEELSCLKIKRTNLTYQLHKLYPSPKL